MCRTRLVPSSEDAAAAAEALGQAQRNMQQLRKSAEMLQSMSKAATQAKRVLGRERPSSRTSVSL